jgi:hypothetical protein
MTEGQSGASAETNFKDTGIKIFIQAIRQRYGMPMALVKQEL